MPRDRLMELAGVEGSTAMRIVRELAAERNPVAKIAFLTRLTEAAVREVLVAAGGAEVRACAPTTRLASSVTPPSPGDAKARSRAPNHACPPSSRTRRASECCE